MPGTPSAKIKQFLRVPQQLIYVLLVIRRLPLEDPSLLPSLLQVLLEEEVGGGEGSGRLKDGLGPRVGAGDLREDEREGGRGENGLGAGVGAGDTGRERGRGGREEGGRGNQKTLDIYYPSLLPSLPPSLPPYLVRASLQCHVFGADKEEVVGGLVADLDVPMGGREGGREEGLDE